MTSQLCCIQGCVAVLAALTPLARANCDSFDIDRPSNRSWYTKFDRESLVQVSEMLKCDADASDADLFPSIDVTDRCDSDQCLLPTTPHLYIRLNRTLSVTVSDEITEFIFDEVVTTVNRELEESNHTSSIFTGSPPENLDEDFDWVDFNATSVWPSQNGGIASICLNQSQAAHWSLMPIRVCVNGTASGCDGLDENVAIEACGTAVAKVSQHDKFGTKWGSLEVIDVDFETMADTLADVQNASLTEGENPRLVPQWAGGPNPHVDATSNEAEEGIGTRTELNFPAVIAFALAAWMMLQ